jgi:NAD(P)-dependent dehydrogenase (short-subunit alcohol dehydrogenase family)
MQDDDEATMTTEPAPLQGRTAVIAGGSGAIGSATARALVRDGAHVLIAGRTEARLAEIADRLDSEAKAAGGSIGYVVADGLKQRDLRKLVEAGVALTGRLDMACNVVGRGAGPAPILRTTAESVMNAYRVSTLSAFLLLKEAGAAMVNGGGGSFVAVSSMQATEPAPLLGAYCAAKAGLEMLCRVAADELGPHSVRVNLVRPGLVRTGSPDHPSADPRAVAAYLEQQPLNKRVGEGSDIAAAIRYYLGPESEWTTGTALTVDGGASLRRFPKLDFYWREHGLGDEIDKASRGELGAVDPAI